MKSEPVSATSLAICVRKKCPRAKKASAIPVKRSTTKLSVREILKDVGELFMRTPDLG